MEGSEAKGPRGSPAGLNNTGQNAVGHPSLRFLNRREIVARVGEKENEKKKREGEMGQRVLPRDFCLNPAVTYSRQM
jgi:hypothetical protein